MILTVTPHPALDYTIRLDGIEIGRRGRYRDPAVDPSGKGINASRMLRRLGAGTLALGLSGGHTGAQLEEGLAREDVPHEFLRVPAATRINVTLITGEEGTATHLHGPGGAVDAAAVEGLLGLVRRRLDGASLLLLSGSLPPGMPPETCGELVRLAVRAGVRTLVDVEGAPLAAALAAGAFLVKPNRRELQDFLGRPLEGEAALVAGARELRDRGAATVVVTDGAEGAWAIDGEGVWRVLAPREEGVRSVGAGDSFAAGLALGLSRGEALPDALRLAAAAGAATARSPGSALGSAADVAALRDRVTIRAWAP
jgi:1-phosphofructokinase family hexose kinase